MGGPPLRPYVCPGTGPLAVLCGLGGPGFLGDSGAAEAPRSLGGPAPPARAPGWSTGAMLANTGVTAVIAGGLIGLGAHRRRVELGEQSRIEKVDMGSIGTGPSIYDSTWGR